MTSKTATDAPFRFGNPDERKLWKDAVLVTLRDCLNLTQGKAGPGCAQLATETADDVVRALRQRNVQTR